MSLNNARKRRRARASLFQQQHGICYLCDRPMDLGILSQHHPGHVTLDHVKAVAHGGTFHRLNLRAAHRACNIFRGRHTPEEGRRLVREAIERATSKDPARWNRRDRFIMLVPGPPQSLSTPSNEARICTARNPRAG